MSIYDEEHKMLFKKVIKDRIDEKLTVEKIDELFENFCIDDKYGEVVISKQLLNPKDLFGDEYTNNDYEHTILKLVFEKVNRDDFYL